MTTIDDEIAIHFAKIDKHMKEVMMAVGLIIVLIIISMSYFFWFITK